MDWVGAEYVLVAVAALASPTTLTWSVLVLVLSPRPLRTGVWFYLGALTATLAIGIAAAFVLGDAAASGHPSTPKTWVAVVDVVLAALLLTWIARVLRRPQDVEKTAAMTKRMQAVTTSPAVAIFGAGAALANPGIFVPVALKTISELDPSPSAYVLEWTVFALVSLLPLATMLVLLLVAPAWTARVLGVARAWLERHARAVAAVLVVLLAVSLLRSGIAGLV